MIIRVCSQIADIWFRYRSVSIIIEEGYVPYYSIGGGVHLGEAAGAAIKREVLEEAGG